MEQISKINRTRDFQIDYFDATIGANGPLEHFHDSFELDFFIKADIELFCRDRTYHISDGDMLFINEFDLHKIIYKPEKEYARFVINFKRSFLEETLKSLGIEDILGHLTSLKSSCTRLTLKRSTEVQSAFQNIYRQSTKQDAPYNLAKVKIQLAQLLINFSEYMETSSVEQTSNPLEVLVKKAIGYIDSNYMKPLTLDLLEQELFASKYYISHIFKQLTGFTIIEYLQSRRIIEVQKRLINTAKPAELISSECGFNNIQHFYKTFKEITKLTPKKYRDLNKRKHTHTQ